MFPAVPLEGALRLLLERAACCLLRAAQRSPLHLRMQNVWSTCFKTLALADRAHASYLNTGHAC